ncbi:putative transcription factor TFIID complex subunit 8 C-term [Lyophyllum shimeji]|uniref:Transcription initiation factor TFIID subunit 8 n=1 Tax=Lyophyllum shimeji TaxID=47721 RepID=A0A9P3UJP1_LYOSH|nr:putative transcription factor TFIID complex subunit 8 C-term [Lyophyllum shimeji]
MYQPPTPAESSSPAQLYNPYSPHTHYPSAQYPVAAPAPPAILPQLPYLPPYTNVQTPKPTSVQELAPPPPDLTSITPEVASRALQRLIAAELRDAGFDSAQVDAVKRIEVEVAAFVEQLFHRAHEYANLSNRAGPIATDLILACDEFNMPPKALRSVPVKSRKRKRKAIAGVRAPTLLAAPPCPPSPKLLPSDDEGTPITIPPTLRMLPHHIPTLPPKHTYLRTPASPPKKAALPSLEKKLKTASLVQESLKNLLLATEDSTNQEDGELLGHIVNWEMGMHPRKRWKSSKK